MSIKVSFKDKQLNTSEINKDNLFVSLVFYGLETCVKNAQVHDEGGDVLYCKIRLKNRHLCHFFS